MTNFNSLLDNILSEAIPKWRRMRAARKSKERMTKTQVQEPNDNELKNLASELQKNVQLMPADIRPQYQELTQEINNNLGIIKTILPSLGTDIEEVSDSLFKGVGAHIAVESMAGEPHEHLQRSYLNVLKKLQDMYSLIPSDHKYNPVRVNIRIIRDYLRKTIGRRIMEKPSGE